MSYRLNAFFHITNSRSLLLVRRSIQILSSLLSLFRHTLVISSFIGRYTGLLVIVKTHSSVNGHILALDCILCGLTVFVNHDNAKIVVSVASLLAVIHKDSLRISEPRCAILVLRQHSVLMCLTILAKVVVCG